MPIDIKICGINSKNIIQTIVQNGGCQYLGFVFYPLRAQADPIKSTVAFSDAASKSGVKIKINEEVKSIEQNSDNTYNLQT